MQTFKLRSGHTVTATRMRTGFNVEFVTANAEGEVISTVRHSLADAVPLIANLRRESA